MNEIAYTNMVSVPISKYDDLLRAEEKIKTLERVIKYRAGDFIPFHEVAAILDIRLPEKKEGAN